MTSPAARRRRPRSRRRRRQRLPFDPSPVLVALVQIVLVLAPRSCVLVVLVQLIRSLLRRRPHLELHEEPDFAIPLVPTELLEAARARLRDLETGEPRNAIVAAWLGLETSAAATGLPRLPAETSTRVHRAGHRRVARRLGAARRPRRALPRGPLLACTSSARAHRDRAIDDLRVLIADLERVATRQAADGPGAGARADGRAGRAGGVASHTRGRGREQLAGRHTCHGRAPS